MLITRTSQYSGKTHTMDIPVSHPELAEIESGTGRFIQVICPNLSPDQREFLLTGITAEEWDEMFPDLGNEVDEEDPRDDEDSYAMNDMFLLSDEEQAEQDYLRKMEDAQDEEERFWYYVNGQY